jgi:multiple sugar transport system permease protein
MPTKRLRWHNALGLMAALVFALFPIFWMVATSFKPIGEWAATPPVWLPREPTLANYRPLIETYQDNFITARGAGWHNVLDSFIVAGSATALSLFVGLLGAIGFSRYHAGGDHLAIAILAVRAIPPVTIAIPFLVLFGALGMHDTHIGVILVNAVFTVPFAFWMLKSFIDDVPIALEEQAMMDGLGRWRSHFTVTVPLIRGGLVATGLFIFILNWSEFLITVTLTEKTVVTLPVALRLHEGLPGVQAAIAVCAALPIVIAGFAIQRHLARAFTLGAIKR